MALPVERLNSDFEGEFSFRGRTYSVPFTLPGDLVQFRLQRRGRGKPGIDVLRIEPAGEYPPEIGPITPFCPQFGRCGGCRGQLLPYDVQLRIKSAPLREFLESRFEVEPEIRAAPERTEFRNRMDFVVNGPVIGLREAGKFNSFIDLESCPVLKQPGGEILREVRGLLKRYPGAAFVRDFSRPDQTAEGCGPLKYVTIRTGSRSGVIVLTISSDGTRPDEYERLRAELRTLLESPDSRSDRFDFSLLETVIPGPSEASCGPGGRVIFGRDEFVEQLGGREFSVGYDSFFQPNPGAFHLLLDWCRRELEQHVLPLQNAGTLLDLYSGAGVLSAIFTAAFPDSFRRVVGRDSTASAIERAAYNLRHFNGRTEFQTSDLQRGEEGLLPADTELILLDPPRTGLSADLVVRLQWSGVAWLLYISCNPRTQLRDLEKLSVAYEVISACIVDCFPWTPHLEQAVLLRRRIEIGLEREVKPLTS